MNLGRLAKLTVKAFSAALLGMATAGLIASNVAVATESACASDGAVPDAANNPGLVSDCAALLAARDTLRGTATLNWASDTDITQWEGVIIDGTPQRVTRLSLESMKLTGEIPAELGNLSNLSSLWLGGNELTGEIPAELENLSNLGRLGLSGNELTGEIPAELGSLYNLDSIWLHSNQLTGEIPAELGNLSNLQVLVLSGNKLSGEIPPELGNLSNLSLLWLWGNKLTGEIPTELLNLSNLGRLDLSGNELTGEIPAELENLSNLYRLGLNDNQLTGEIPAELGNLSNLQVLGLSGNQLTGEIPTEFGNLSNLDWLRLDRNQLTGEIPTELGSLYNLYSIWLNDNQLTGAIPSQLDNLSNLERLFLRGNHLTGCIPQGLRDVPYNDLDLLGLFYCGDATAPGSPNIAAVRGGASSLFIVWNAPSETGGLIITAYDLRYIETSDDETTDSNWTVVQDVWTTGGGALQYTLTGLNSGTEYDLQVRAVKSEGDGPWSATAAGTPADAGDCASGGAVFDPANNPGLVSDCATLLAARDTLAGIATLNWAANTPITQWLGITISGVPGRVTQLFLIRRGLTGKIPAELGNLSNLQWLGLSGNQLAGRIPTELGNLSNLFALRLGKNRLTGEIPTELGNLSNLGWLRLDGNQLTGEIPTEFGNLSNLEWLELGDNQLAGEIPRELGNLPNLTELDLHDNQLTGEIPTEFGNLSNLESLRLDGNQLTGEIPTEFGNLSNLEWLRLNRNQLTGEIPRELGNLPNLTELYLRWNQLTGEIPASLGDLSNLTNLDLTGNEFTGEIPTTLGNLSNLERLKLGYTHVTGDIPKELGNLSKLQYLDLTSNQLTGEIPKELGDLLNLRGLFLSGNRVPGCIPETVRQLLPNLTETDVKGLPACTGVDVVHTVDEDPQPYNGNLFVMPIEEDLTNFRSLRRGDYMARFFEYFEDEFDFLFLVANIDTFVLPRRTLIYHFYQRVRNNVNGIGISISARGARLGSEETLQGAIALAHLNAFSRGPSLHELMHRWANFVLPSSSQGHWGFSSANGQLGGFDIADLVDHGGDRYSAGVVAPAGVAANWRPYSPIELYLAGFIPPEDVPDLWVAEDGKYLVENGRPVRTEDGDNIFTASKVRTYAIEDFIAEHGERIPNSSQSQREFRAAAILLIDKDHPLVKWQLDAVSADIAAFSYAGADEDDETYNFYEATGGRATITMDGLSQFLRDTVPAFLPGTPNDLKAEGNGLPGIDLSWTAPASDGGSEITAYDLRYIETAADETVDSNWIVVEDVWTTGSGALEYTLTGLTTDTEYDLQLRAVNAVGDGPWSATAMATTQAASVCVTGGAVSDAANTGLVSDCEALLAAEAILAVSVSLNWAEDTPIAQWDGIRLGGASRRVTRLALPGKGLGGTVPSQLGELSMLTDLNLRTNQLSGPIPVELGDLSSLVRLNLHTNQLTGPIPDLGGLTGLEELYLARNMLVGPVPEWLNGMTEMRELWLWGNELSGTIPDLSGMTSLEKLKLAANNLEGGVPGASALPANLRWLIIQENPLGGTIPDLSGMTRLAVLWLHTNELTGQVPASHLPPNVTSVNLHSNQLSGEIPDLSGLDKLQWLRLQNNQLSGMIPSTLGEMESLTRLWLHENMLSGTIPAWLGGLTKLQRLWLSDNMLSGEIPSELGELGGHSLVQWRLAGNDITGCVPAGLAGVEDGDLERLGLLVCSDS